MARKKTKAIIELYKEYKFLVDNTFELYEISLEERLFEQAEGYLWLVQFYRKQIEELEEVYGDFEE